MATALATSDDERFYAELTEIERFEDVADLGRYRAAPSAWYVVLTDVRGSTKAIEAGRYKDVNALGVASIVAVRNAAPGLELPYVFGGDGATLLVPGSRLEAIKPALRGLRRTAEEAFGLGLRVGVVPVSELRAAGHDVLVARFRASGDAAFAMLGGSGLSEAERLVKDPDVGARYEVDEGPSDADYAGFQCRWQPIPAQRGEMLSLLVQARAEDRRAAGRIYADVFAAIQRILEGDGRPVARETLRLATRAALFDAEAKLKSGRAAGLVHAWRRVQASSVTRIGRFLLKTGWNALGFPGATYRDAVVANTDFRKFDDTLRMVIDVTPEQHAAIEQLLSAEHAAGRLVYGMHTAAAALMTCVITDTKANHVHFVDGADGGYALAAKQLKAQLKALPR
ncbi:MAG: DUF3095 domain-containing protein [Myxococcales bacterium]|nr:DUF3095 domain-containing protein [Myxococcales bacterium]